MNCDELSNLLIPQRFNFGSELELQDGIESVIRGVGLIKVNSKDRMRQGEYGREVKLDCGRIDFLVGDIGVEVEDRWISSGGYSTASSLRAIG